MLPPYTGLAQLDRALYGRRVKPMSGEVAGSIPASGTGFKQQKMKCATKYCRNTVKREGAVCRTCKTRQWREENPERSAWLNLKHNAKRRGKAFDLTFEQFQAFAVRTGYMKKKGRFQDNWHIDRILEEAGYTYNNLQVLHNGINVKKYLEYNWNGKEMEYYTKVVKPHSVPVNAPF